jgi:glucose-6-phosphate isomerase
VSNGKSVTREGRPVRFDTAPVVWGGPGINGQHAFFQLLHQGTTVVPCDFIGVLEPHHPLVDHHDLVAANLIAQTAALAFGRNGDSGEDPGQIDSSAEHRRCSGNRPSTTILLPRLNPYNLGQLIALYEHKTFTQGVVWGINSFDQWGVELGKELAQKVHADLVGPVPVGGHDSSTAHLIDRYRASRQGTRCRSLTLG